MALIELHPKVVAFQGISVSAMHAMHFFDDQRRVIMLTQAPTLSIVRPVSDPPVCLLTEAINAACDAVNPKLLKRWLCLQTPPHNAQCFDVKVHVFAGVMACPCEQMGLHFIAVKQSDVSKDYTEQRKTTSNR
jgi:hypothetical protein